MPRTQRHAGRSGQGIAQRSRHASGCPAERAGHGQVGVGIQRAARDDQAGQRCRRRGQRGCGQINATAVDGECSEALHVAGKDRRGGHVGILHRVAAGDCAHAGTEDDLRGSDG